MKFEGQNYRVELLATESGIAIVGGHFGQARIAYGELFKLRMKHVETGEVRILTSLDGWRSVDVRKENETTKFVFSTADACERTSTSTTCNCVEFIV